MILMPGPPPPGSWGYQAMPPSQMQPQEWSNTGEPPVNPSSPQPPQEDLQAQGTPPPSYYSLAPQPETAQGLMEAASQNREPEAGTADENKDEDAPAEEDHHQEDQGVTSGDGGTGGQLAAQPAGVSGQGGLPVGGQLQRDQGPALRPRPSSLGLSSAKRRRRRPRFSRMEVPEQWVPRRYL